MSLLSRTILRNRAKCLLCGDIVESGHRHDYRTCSCGALSVDGGKDYLRRSYRDESKVEELNEFEELTSEIVRNRIDAEKRQIEADEKLLPGASLGRWGRERIAEAEAWLAAQDKV